MESNFIDVMVSKLLEGAVEFVRAQLVKTGLENWTLESWENEHAAEIPELFNVRVHIEKMRSMGFSDFVVHKLKFNSTTSKVAYDVSIPKLFFSLGKGGFDAAIFGTPLRGNASGQLSIMEARIAGEAHIEISPDFSICLRSINVQTAIKSIKSQLKVQINDSNYSKMTNNYLQKTIPEFLEKHKDKINEALAKMIEAAVPNYKPGTSESVLNMF